ncbi:aminotransferase class I/II-fold pyridoxal phosphate-dependent enzyme [uncultured Agrococcus sp.]|uniref:O-acetylhomoserine aminocarboxypropyltransferase/cysteine synthase family protein n=1 Tax=uncultured Agrococcus sp. TaxID=382258 RepID=UPI0025D65230|nr:aminotransferase class I/II-fold pyridoxal phosphate-dependent enzyme [uncultured Agrococcus sp.]
MTGFTTRQVHAGAIIDAETKSRVTPIYQTSGYVFDSFDDGKARFAGMSKQRAYSRTDNPTNTVAAQRIANLEGGVDGILVGSGQAAIATVIFSLANAGDHVLTTKLLYEGTREMFRGSLQRQGVSSTAIDEHAQEDAWLAAVRPETKAIYTESIPNPVGGVTDLGLLSRVAKRAGLPLIVDNTVATPYLCRPFEHGADIIIHSTSKWLGGHGSVIGGAIIDGGTFDWEAHADRFPQFTAAGAHGRPSAKERYGAAAYTGYLRWSIVIEYGPTLPPTSAFLLLHGIETLSLRMQRHIENTHRVAKVLVAHPAVARVHHADLPGSPYRELAKKYTPLGAGSVVTIELAGGRDAARTFLDSLELTSQMTHIGDVRTLAIHTGSTIHGKLTTEEKAEVDINDSLVRISVGIEDADDIIADLVQALDTL